MKQKSRRKAATSLFGPGADKANDGVQKVARDYRLVARHLAAIPHDGRDIVVAENGTTEGSMALKLGIYLNSQHPAGDDPARRFDETLEQVRLVRSLGFDLIWAGEHHITPGFHFFPQLPLLHRLAGEAEGLWIGTNVTLLPLHNPVELAEAGAFLDVITGGKFLLGVGLGYRPEEYQIFGVPMSERVSRFTEAVEIIRRLWSEDRVTHSGRHWQFSDATIAPRPLQAPRPPIIIGAQVDAAIARAARIGDGWLSVPTSTLDQLDAQMSAFKSARSATKLPPAEHFCRLLEVGCAADDETAIRRSAPFLMEKYKSYVVMGPGRTYSRSERRPRATVPRAGVQAVRGGRARKCHRYAGRPTSLRHQPPFDARELAGDGPGRDPRQHRASWPQGSSRGAAPNRGRGAVAPPSKAASEV